MAKPVLFGPTIQNAYEASLLVEQGGAKLVHTAQELAAAITAWLKDTEASVTAGRIRYHRLEKGAHKGASFTGLLLKFPDHFKFDFIN